MATGTSTPKIGKKFDRNPDGMQDDLDRTQTLYVGKGFFKKKVSVKSIYFSKEIIEKLMNYENMAIDGLKIEIGVNEAHEIEYYLFPHTLSTGHGPIPGPGVGR